MLTPNNILMEGSLTMRRLRLRYPSTCAMCGGALAKGAEAAWDREAKKALCLGCLASDLLAGVRGEAGASALAKAEQLERREVEQAQRRWGDEAASVAARVAGDDPSISAWEKGGDGESRLARFIEREVGDRVIALHDRVIPGTRSANIDHIFVAPGGVWVVDAKTYSGRLERRKVGPPWREQNQIRIDGRDRTKLVDGMKVQLKAVRAALEPDPAHPRIPIHAALCFVDTEWALLARPFDVRGVTVMYPGALRSRLMKDGPLARTAMERIATRLALSLPTARSN